MSSRATAFRRGYRSSTPQHAAANGHVRARWKNSCSYDAVHACRQRTAKVSLGRIDVHRGFSGQQGAALRDRHAVSVRNAIWDGAGSAILRFIGAQAFVHIKTYSKKLELKAVEKRRVGYSNNRKSYRVYNPVTRCIMESRNVIFMETPSRHRWKKLRSRFIRQATAWTTTTTSQATTFCAVFTITFPCWNRFPGRLLTTCLLYTSPSPRDQRGSRMPSSA